MRARIINKNYLVSKVVTQYAVNGRIQDRTELMVDLKPKAARSNRADRVVFRAIHLTGSHDWDKVYNYLNATNNNGMVNCLEKELNRHCI